MAVGSGVVVGSLVAVGSWVAVATGSGVLGVFGSAGPQATTDKMKITQIAIIK